MPTYRLMYDSVTPHIIPRNAGMVAGYGNGRYVWTQADWDLFPHAAHVHIDVNGSDPLQCGVLDVERFDATPEQAPDWIRARRARRHPATIYCSRSVVPAVQAACAGLKYSLWVADWTNAPHEVDGAVAVQYAADQGPGYDVSAVYDDNWHSHHVSPGGGK